MATNNLLARDLRLTHNLYVENDGRFDCDLTTHKDLRSRRNLVVDGTSFLTKVKINETVRIDDTTDSSDSTNGSIRTHGGMGISKNLNVGGNVAINQDLNVVGNMHIHNDDQSSSPVTGALTVSGGIGLEKNLHCGGSVFQQNYLLVPIGSIFTFAGSSAPAGYLICDGATVNRISYSNLFSVIGTTYGPGNNTTTFNLPDMRNRFPIGVGLFNLGVTGGSSTATLTTNELPSHTHSGTTDSNGNHTHSITDPGHSHGRLNAIDDNNGSNNPGQAPVGDANDNYTSGYPTQSAQTGISIQSAGNHSHSFTTNPSGAGNAFSILNPYISINFIIKY